MKRRYLFLLDAAFLAAIPLGTVLSRWMNIYLPDCIFRKTGFLCPACGGLGCAEYLTRGDFREAMHRNPYFFFTAWIVLALLVLLNIKVLSGDRWGAKLWKWLWRPVWVIVWAAGFALFGILRNFI